MRNINQIFFNNVKLYKDKPLFWYKKDLKWFSISWKKTLEEKEKLSNALKSLNIKKNDKVAIICPNSPQWCISDLSIMSLGAVTVPGYITSTENELEYLLNHSESKGIFVSLNIFKKIKKIEKKLKFLKFVICLENHEKALKTIDSYHYEYLLENFKKIKNKSLSKISIIKDDIACIIYTSGTSSRPKGVMLTHGSIIENIKGAKNFVNDLGKKNHKFLSIIPLSHAYEHTGGFLLPMYIGAEIFFNNNREHLISDIQFAKPTLMVAVPRLYDLLFKRISQNINTKGNVTKYLFKKTLQIGEEKYSKKNISVFNRFLDLILHYTIRKKIKELFGNNLIAFISGGAALNFKSGLFFSSLGIKILQGYGQTECSPIISVNPINKIKLKTVGIPIFNNKVKLSKNKEILVKGPSVMKGYWKDNTSTKKVIKRGWLHTGDLGKIDEEKYVTIVGRINEMIVNSGGENIAPVPIEELITSFDEIDQAMVYGQNKSYLVALIYPSLEIGKNIKLIKTIFDKVNTQLSVEKKIRKFHLIDKSFSIESGELTPTLKLKRRIIEKNYQKQIRNMYPRD